MYTKIVSKMYKKLMKLFSPLCTYWKLTVLKHVRDSCLCSSAIQRKRTYILFISVNSKHSPPLATAMRGSFSWEVLGGKTHENLDSLTGLHDFLSLMPLVGNSSKLPFNCSYQFIALEASVSDLGCDSLHFPVSSDFRAVISLANPVL